MNCPVCNLEAARIGILCGRCRDRLVGPKPITPEQIQRCGPASSYAAFVDVWGALHGLSPELTIGRTIEPPALTVLTPSVSRHHAIVVQTPKAWTIRDLRSRNGTFVEGRSAARPLELRNGNIVRVGIVQFYFLEDASTIGSGVPLAAQGQTHKPTSPLTARDLKLGTREMASILPVVRLKLQEPTGGGGGVVEILGKRLHLSLPQYELFVLLVDRMLERRDDPEITRGFYKVAELVKRLSLESTQADEDNIRHLVHRVRRACEKAGIRELIESKYRLGYRLTITPEIR